LEKTIEVSGKKIVVRELKYKDLANFKQGEESESVKKIMLLSTQLTEEEYNELSLRDGLAIQKIVNELNGLADFQNPLTSTK
jgi:hypothetical protein